MCDELSHPMPSEVHFKRQDCYAGYAVGTFAVLFREIRGFPYWWASVFEKTKLILAFILKCRAPRFIPLLQHKAWSPSASSLRPHRHPPGVATESPSLSPTATVNGGFEVIYWRGWWEVRSIKLLISVLIQTTNAQCRCVMTHWPQLAYA